MSLEDVWGVVVKLYAFLTSALHEYKCPVSTYSRCISGEGTPGIHYIGGWMGPSKRLDVIFLAGNQTPVSSP
jgi:hypothetical protein